MQNQMNHRANGFFDRLAARRGNLSPKMLRVARFMETNYLDGAFMSTRELATAAGVSLATVVRFPKVLGYATFDELREAIQDHVNIELTGVQRLASPPRANTASTELLRRVVEEDIDTLRTLVSQFSEAQLEHFVTLMEHAERILVLGFRYVAPLTHYCAYSLNKIRGGVESFMEADSSLYDRVRFLGENDLVLAIGFARYPADLVRLLQYAHGRSCRIACITDSNLSPLLPVASAHLFAKGTIRDFVGSLSAPGALINCLVSQLAQRLGDTAQQRLAAAEEAAVANGTYVEGSEGQLKSMPGWQDSLLHQVELAQG
jgi:DNA-binding MurR/RpiR family transcriptional regulator